MRILVSGLTRATKPSGVCRFASNLALALSMHEEVVLAVGNWQEAYFAESFGLRDKGIRVEPIAIENKSIDRNRWYLKGFPQLAQDLGAEVAHANIPIPVKRRRNSVKIVGTVHDLYPFDAPENFGFPHYLLNQFAFRQFIRYTDGVTCVSGVTLARLRELFPAETSRLNPPVVYNSVVPVEGALRPSGLPSSNYVLAVAQHRKNKNLLDLVRAIGIIRDSGPDLVIVGTDGPESVALRGLVESLGLQNRVFFLSGITDRDLRGCYEGADALVAPSLHEGFCLPVAEALMYGCPVIVSDIPIFHEIAQDNACYLERLTPHGIAEAIAKVCSATRPSVKLPDSFNLERAASEYSAFYGRLLALSAS